MSATLQHIAYISVSIIQKSSKLLLLLSTALQLLMQSFGLPNHFIPSSSLLDKGLPIWHFYLLTYSMVQSPSWEANWFAASQEIPRISWNPKVHYRTHKRLPPVPILGQPNPVHIPTSHLLDIHLNIIHPSTPRHCVNLLKINPRKNYTLPWSATYWTRPH